ncbi:MAG: glycosyltransferase [Verrucomicrobiota bacterium]
MIPKILHQTHRSRAMLEANRELTETFTALHPEWEYRFYDDAEQREVIATCRPDLLQVFDSYPKTIQRADMFRVVIVQAAGGFYADMDIAFHQALDPLCHYQAVFAEEVNLPEKERIKLGHTHGLRVANYMFGAEANHPLLAIYLEQMKWRARDAIEDCDDVLESTGPALLTSIYHDYAKENPTKVHLVKRVQSCECKHNATYVTQFGHYACHLNRASWRFERGIYHPLGKNLFALGTYHEHPFGFDGLSHVYKRVIQEPEGVSRMSNPFSFFKSPSKPNQNPKTISSVRNAKVVVAGIPHLYRNQLDSTNKNICFTTFETDQLPELWVDSLNRFYTHCIVPHKSVADAFRNSGVTIPVSVVHQGYSRFSCNPQPSKEERDNPFRIGFLGVPQRRKNLTLLVDACENLLERFPHLRLVIHIATRYDETNSKEIEAMKKASFVELTEGKLSEEQLGHWYSGLSAYAFPSSGEGWSFTPRESLYMGIPTLVSDIPVHRELIDSGYVRTIQSTGKVPAIHDVIVQNQAGQQQRKEQVFGQWHKIEVASIEEALAEVVENHTEYQAKAKAGSKWIASLWKNEDSKRRLFRVLNSI